MPQVPWAAGTQRGVLSPGKGAGSFPREWPEAVRDEEGAFWRGSPSFLRV